MFGDESQEEKTFNESHPQDPLTAGPTLPKSKARGKGGSGFKESGSAKDAKDAGLTKDAYKHEINLKQIERDVTKQANDHELRKIGQQAEIDRQSRDDTAHRRYQTHRFFVPLGVVVVLTILDILAYLFGSFPPEKLAPVDGLVRLVIGWLTGLVSVNMIKPAVPKPKPQEE